MRTMTDDRAFAEILDDVKPPSHYLHRFAEMYVAFCMDIPIVGRAVRWYARKVYGLDLDAEMAASKTDGID